MRYGFDPLALKYPSKRIPVYARNGMVNCSSPMAAAAGLEALRKGGNAVDAVVAAAAALTVVEPTSNGVGSDAFAIVWSEKEKRLFGLNSSGPAPMLASADRIASDYGDTNGRMPKFGWAPVTVPGAPKAWAELSDRFGQLSLAETMAPAVSYARDGYPCAALLAREWERAYRNARAHYNGACFDAWFKTFAPSGAPKAGDIICLPDLADTLEAIGESKADAFYAGEYARRIDEASRRAGGYIRYEDLASYQAEWVDPLRLNYRGYEVCEIPPNGQGITALIALNILKEFRLTDRNDPETVHRQLEAMKMAFADSLHYVTDPRFMELDYQRFLNPEYGAARAREMEDRAKVWTHGTPPKSGTVYLCAADREGNMASYIQSNYWGFGSGIVIDGTGISLQNRGFDFSLDPGAANYLRPGKRSYHTIIPGFLMRDGKPVGPFGVMGAYMQPQGHVQVVSNFVDFHMDPQQALDAPRWQWQKDGRITMESGFDADLVGKLRSRGHDIEIDPDISGFGRGQMIVRLDNGVLVGGTEPRTDSSIACF